MSLLEETIAKIQPADHPAAMEAAAALDQLFPEQQPSALQSLLLRYLRATGKPALFGPHRFW